MKTYHISLVFLYIVSLSPNGSTDFAFDGDLNTYWHPIDDIANYPLNQQWIEIDMGEILAVKKVVVAGKIFT